MNQALRVTTVQWEALAEELDKLRQETLARCGAEDRAYIERIVAYVRYSEAAGRGMLMLGWLPPFWLLGTAALSFSKILENMELGHNVMHGQYDWMHEPSLQGKVYEWDNVCPADQWRHSHNYMHHTYTNIVGRDRDVGYGILRLFPDQPWYPAALAQPLYALILALAFEWGVALHDLEFEKLFKGEKSLAQLREELRPILAKIKRQTLKDYVFFPVLAGPSFLPVLLGNFTANLVRNIWAFTIIFCGHFTEEVETFPDSCLAHESRGQWYRRQILGSSNIEGGRWFHILSGNLSHQIEHHLFPDLPAWRYAEMAPRVKAIAAKYGLRYHTGSLGQQVLAAGRRILRYALPDRLFSRPRTELV